MIIYPWASVDTRYRSPYCAQPLCEESMLKESLEIMFAKDDDLQAIAELSRDEIEYDLGWAYNIEKLTRIKRDSTNNLIVGKFGNELAGFGLMTYRSNQANLDLLGIKPKYRRRGIATQIVEWLVCVADNAGLYNVFVQLRKDNVAARQFYTSIGFIEIDEIKEYYHRLEDGVIMSKPIRALFSVT